MHLIPCLYCIDFQVDDNPDLREWCVFLGIYELHPLPYRQFHWQVFFLRDFGSVRLTRETALTPEIWCPGRNPIWLARQVFQWGTFTACMCCCVLSKWRGYWTVWIRLAGAAMRGGLWSLKETYNFRRKNGPLGNVWRKDLPALVTLRVFSTHFMPTAWVSQCMSHWNWKSVSGNRPMCQISALPWPCRRGRQLCLVPSHSPGPCELCAERNGREHQRKGK